MKVTLNATSAFNVTLNGTNAVSEFSQMTLNSGTLNLAGTPLNLTLSAPPAVGNTYRILNNVGGTVIGQFACGPKVSAIFNGKTYWFTINYSGGDGDNDIVLTSIPLGTLVSLR